MISVVFPAYNEEENVEELHRRLTRVMTRVGEPFEIVAVNNASTDRTRERLLTLAPVVVVSLASNLGQSAALDAGIAAARGNIIVTIDGDLQNDPDDIPMMLGKLGEGYDAVVGWRQDRHDAASTRMTSRMANGLARRVLGLDVHDFGCALKAFRKEFIQGVRLYGEMHVYLAAILHYRGARIVEVPVRHFTRKSGVSKHSFRNRAKNLVDLFTIKFLMGTTRPMLLFGVLGLGSGAMGSMAMAAAVTLKIMGLRNFAQTPLPVIGSLFILAGLLLVMLGILAELIIRVYYEGRHQAPYVVRDVITRER